MKMFIGKPNSGTHQNERVRQSQNRYQSGQQVDEYARELSWESMVKMVKTSDDNILFCFLVTFH